MTAVVQLQPLFLFGKNPSRCDKSLKNAGIYGEVFRKTALSDSINSFSLTYAAYLNKIEAVRK